MWFHRPNGRSTFVVVLVFCSVLGNSLAANNKRQDAQQTGKKRASAGTGAGTEAETGANTGAATASDSSSESQTFTNTKVNTRIATSSNARSGANAAAKVKTYAHANTETKVDTQQQKPTPPPEIPPTTTPGGPEIFPPPPGPPENENGNCTNKCKEKEVKPPIIKVYCPNCPCPCPPPCPCVCPCPPPPPPPPPPCPVPCLPPCPPPCGPPLPPPCPVPCPEPCPCDVQMLGPHLAAPMPCPMDCPVPPCPCPFKRDKISERLKQKRRRRRRRHRASKRMNAAGKQPNLAYAKPLEFSKAAVAADNIICSRMGRDILKKGGSAADAIVTTHCCVEVVNSHSTGLGGGGFMVYYDKESGKATSYDFRETLPLDYKDTKNKTLGETVLVPGVLRGLEAVWKDYGKLNWTTLWDPCISLAENGFRIHEALAAGIVKKADYIMANLGLRELFAPSGRMLKFGHLLKRPKLARTYRKIASHGADYFYRGQIAKQIVDDVREAGGVLQMADLANFQVHKREALTSRINRMKLFTTAAPSSGALMALALKIMSNFKWKPRDLLKEPALVYHQMVEAMKFAYAPTTYLGDPKFTRHVNEVEAYMMSPKTARRMFKRIDRYSHPVEYYKPYSQLFWTQKTATSHMSVLDAKGSAVSLTSSINAYFGSKLRSRELGFIYNNELADFSEFWPTIYNLTSDIKIPGKRPMSKVMPAIFVRGKTVMGVWGAAGGFFIPSAITMSIANWLFFKDNLKVAITRPRLHCQLFPPTVVYEPTMPPSLIPKLEDFGHKYVTNSTYDVSGQLNAIMGVVQAIVRLPNGKYSAESDYRKGGRPEGF